MNVSKAIEIATATVIREYGNLRDGVTLRTWQKMDQDATWDATQDRAFPLVDIRASAPKTDDNQATLSIDCAVLVGTTAFDDKDHAIISDIYESVQTVLDSLFAQFRTTDGDALTRWKALMSANTTTGHFNFGGFTFGDALAPFENQGANMIGTTLTVHYSRSDF